MNTGAPPNYYAILQVSETASTSQIRDAYKRAALKTHPDRVTADSPERAERTRKFQLVNDAYYTLSDPSRRREYDAQRKLFGQSTGGNTTPGGAGFGEDDPFSEANVPGGAGGAAGGTNSAYSWAWNFFTGQGAENRPREEAERAQFGDAFEEMMQEEGVDQPASRQGRTFWSTLGGASGGVLGYIVGNFPGAVAGAVAGNRLGAVRDTRGKSVYEVFQVSASVNLSIGGGDSGASARARVRRE